METAKNAICVDDPVNPFIATAMQAAGILVVSHVFHLILKPLGQPGPVAQILAGVVFGESGLSRIEIVHDFFFWGTDPVYYNTMASIFYILFTFLIGLETDIPYLKRNIRKAAIVAGGGLAVCVAFGIVGSVLVISFHHIEENRQILLDMFVVQLASTPLAIVIRLAVELKIATADVGRLAICSAMITEMFCLLWFSTHMAFVEWGRFWRAMLILFMTIVMGVSFRYYAAYSNRQHRNRKYVTNAEILAILIMIILAALFIDDTGFKSSLFTYIVGLMFPREGKMTRTIMHKLGYAVYNFMLPVYFGYIGFQCNVTYLNSPRNAMIVGIMVLLSTVGKIIGTLAACQYLRFRMTDGVLLSFLLNMKGHAEIILVNLLPNDVMMKWKIQDIGDGLVLVSVTTTVLSGVAVACILKKNERYFSYRCRSLEMHELEDELRLLTCVYESRYISSKIGLLWALSGSLRIPVTAYLLHLVELPKKRRKRKLMYHQLDDGDQFSDEEEYGGNSVLEINDALDAFSMETKLPICQSKAVSSFARMYEDVCDLAEDLRASIIIITFHKHQRLDGKMEAGKAGMRTTNQKVLLHAPCSVGIFVDRGQTGFQLPSCQSLQNVAVLFFGGPDDREALACSQRVATHPHIKLTVIRLIQSPSTKQNDGFNGSVHDDEMLMSISAGEIDDVTDNAFLQDFHNRYVTSGQVGYIERNVSSGLQTVEALRSIGEMYALFIVGRGRRGDLPMTSNLTDWEECQELGTVGDLLVSGEINVNSSVLVVQQHRHPCTLLRDD